MWCDHDFSEAIGDFYSDFIGEWRFDGDSTTASVVFMGYFMGFKGYTMGYSNMAMGNPPFL